MEDHLIDIRKGVDRIHDRLDVIAKMQEKHNDRISGLETWLAWLKGAWAALGLAYAWIVGGFHNGR